MDRWDGLFALFWPERSGLGQIDPESRRLLQLGYDQPVEGKSPLAGYAFYYWNEPGVWRTNLTLRLVVAPVYLESELGARSLLGPNTDFGLGVQGGGYADSHAEIRQGHYYQEESFTGHGGDLSGSIYHRFNPEQRVPLHGMLRAGVHYTEYSAGRHTSPTFVMPADEPSLHVRGGLRWGGIEPVLHPALAMELSGWYDGRVHGEELAFGYAGDRRVEAAAHLFWARALLAYTLPQNRIGWQVGFTMGTSLNASRLDAFRLGGSLPFASELPLDLPGYYFQELSARRFLQFSGKALLPINPRKTWNLSLHAATALIDYTAGFDQPGSWHSGGGGGLIYRSAKGGWQVAAGYAYGIDALRSDGRGAQSVSILIQYDFTSGEGFFVPGFHPTKWRGFDRLFRR